METSNDTVQSQAPGSENKRLSFDGLPYEIRAMIFQLCDFRWHYSQESWNDGQEFRPPNNEKSAMPDIIIALRPQAAPYYQALEYFFRRSTFDLYEENGHSFTWMSPQTIGKIQKLGLEIVTTRRVPGTNIRDSYTPEIFAAELGKHSIKELHLYFRKDTDGISRPAIDAFIATFPKWLVGFQSLKLLSFSIPLGYGPMISTEDWFSERFHNQKRPNPLDEELGRFDGFVGAVRKNEGRSWEWRPVEEGGVMDWSKVPAEALKIQETAQEQSSPPSPSRARRRRKP